jgi:hypothetical protein
MTVLIETQCDIMVCKGRSFALITLIHQEWSYSVDNPIDPMEEYYDRDAWEVAKELFGVKFDIPGVFYSIVEGDLPFKVQSYGNGKYNTTNLFTNKTSDRGFDGIVVPREEAEALL